MERSYHSGSWYKVAGARPRLREHVRIHRQHFRGQLWYVLQDDSTGRFHRFTPAAYLIISLMDGERTVDEIWDIAGQQLDDDVLTQDEVIRLLAQLHHSDVLYTDTSPDMQELAERERKVRRRKIASSLMNPLAVRLPVLDPDGFLTATMPLARPFFSWLGALAFVAIVGAGLVLAGIHWDELTGDIVDRVLSAESVLLLLVAYPCVKALHELGHGYAVKRWGGEVHEMGVMFLVFMPVPYVDASASAAFPEKWRRALVGAAGIMVELVLASLALMVWLEIEDGWARAFAFNVMLIGGISTLFFNGNPLLRFDGYYVLADVLEIPNLANRANRYIGYLLQRYLFRVEDPVSPATSPSERVWFVVYGLAAFCYRLFIMAAIILLVASQFFVVGVLLAIWACVLMIGVPLGKHLKFLLTSPVLRRRRGRAVAVVTAVVGIIAAVLLFVPVPYATVAEGVVWTPGEVNVIAGSAGTVAEVVAEPNAPVSEGDPLIVLEDPLLDARVRALEARVEEMRLRREAAVVSDPVGARVVLEQLERTLGDLAYARSLQESLVVRSPRDGRFILHRPDDLFGRFVTKGEMLGYVATFDDPVVYVIVTEDSADLVRQRTRHVQVRMVDSIDAVHPARIARELPMLTEQVPNPALTTIGGGEIILDPETPDGVTALERLLQLELRFDRPLPVARMGNRTYVRFDHGTEPLAGQIYFRVRQLFLERFNV